MENDLKIWAALSCLSITSIFNYFAIKDLISERNKFEEKRQVCNRTILAQKKLPEKFDSYVYFSDNVQIKTIDEAEEQINALKNKIIGTNKEVNDLRTLIGCYFDK